ncbi:hypothetical protein MAFF211479_01190 [Ralstonia solanacearum]|nr:hypothetical protein MAFF211479_01190 [Ralstonia solanacearum]BCL95764.1 hypothetical protein MAFF211491_02160 [Ralstonia solanacearum]BCM11026.1 hypothetical protein MAFF241648_02160 [Ralstonia solanacearum]BCN02982.1 hypothetical protein RPSB_01190 [Ralstonia solanacearum]
MPAARWRNDPRARLLSFAIRFGRSGPPSMAVSFPEAVMKSIELPCPSRLSACERAAEIAGILASTIVRTLNAPSAAESAVGLGFVPDQRVHATPYQRETL